MLGGLSQRSVQERQQSEVAQGVNLHERQAGRPALVTAAQRKLSA